MQHSLPIQRKKPNHLTHSTTILLFPLNTHLSLDNDCPRLSTFNQCILIWSNAETLLKVIIKRKTDERTPTPLHPGRRASEATIGTRSFDRSKKEGAERGVRSWWWKYKARRVAGLGQSVNGTHAFQFRVLEAWNSISSIHLGERDRERERAAPPPFPDSKEEEEIGDRIGFDNFDRCVVETSSSRLRT